MDVINIHRHIMESQRDYPEATGELSALLSSMALATKIISRNVNKAGLLNVLGTTGDVNVQGERVMKLDEVANRIIKEIFTYSGSIAGMASEEEEDFVALPRERKRGRYILLFDPLDGSSNIDANVTIGTIFAIYRKVTIGTEPGQEDFLQRGREMVAAGYAVYGSSTMFVYTTGEGVHGFTLDPEYGEFLLSHPNIRLPEACRVYSVNERNAPGWHPGTREFVEHIKQGRDERYRDTAARYIGSLVADFHRNLLYGGVFLYPEDQKNERGKLRLLYECNPMAFIAEAAGGRATTGLQRILDIQPTSIHQRAPFVAGSEPEVALYEQYYQHTQD